MAIKAGREGISEGTITARANAAFGDRGIR
jgi:hypothetical protein